MNNPYLWPIENRPSLPPSPQLLSLTAYLKFSSLDYMLQVKIKPISRILIFEGISTSNHITNGRTLDSTPLIQCAHLSLFITIIQPQIDKEMDFSLLHKLDIYFYSFYITLGEVCTPDLSDKQSHRFMRPVAYLSKNLQASFPTRDTLRNKQKKKT